MTRTTPICLVVIALLLAGCCSTGVGQICADGKCSLSAKYRNGSPCANGQCPIRKPSVPQFDAAETSVPFLRVESLPAESRPSPTPSEPTPAPLTPPADHAAATPQVIYRDRVVYRNRIVRVHYPPKVIYVRPPNVGTCGHIHRPIYQR